MRTALKANIPVATDADLIRKSRQGDESAFGQLVERYQSLACSVAYNRCGDLATSEDLAQEAFMQAWRKLADLENAAKFKSWLCTIVRNLAARSHEQSARSVSTMAAPLDSIVEPTSAAVDPAERVVSAEEEQLVWKALAAIPENYREPMILFYREEQSVAKVAKALEISPDVVKQRLSRGRKFLQEQLAATVQSALEKSKPTQQFTSAVIMGLAGAKTKTVTAGMLTSGAAKSTLGGAGLGGLYFILIAKLPIIAWMAKTQLEEARSPREKQLMLRHLIFWMLALIPMAVLAFATIGWQSGIQSLTLRALFLPGLMALYCIPMIISSRRLGKRIEQLRIEEKTDTPLRSITNNKHGSTRPLFMGSALLVACWPSLMAMFAGDWISIVLLLSLAAVIGLLGSLVPSASPKTSFRTYGVTLCVVALMGLGVMSWQRTAWYDALSNSSDAPDKLVSVTEPSVKEFVTPDNFLRLPETPIKPTEVGATKVTKVRPITAMSPGMTRSHPQSATRRARFGWMASMQAMNMTLAILAILAWKRVYGKQQD